MNRYKKIIVALSLLCIVLAAVEINLLKTLYQEKSLPEAGVISNGDIAIKFAEAIWLPIYGEEIYSRLPFKTVHYVDADQWYVRGTRPEGVLGGVLEIRFNGTDASILRIGFYQ